MEGKDMCLITLRFIATFTASSGRGGTEWRCTGSTLHFDPANLWESVYFAFRQIIIILIACWFRTLILNFTSASSVPQIIIISLLFLHLLIPPSSSPPNVLFVVYILFFYTNFSHQAKSKFKIGLWSQNLNQVST